MKQKRRLLAIIMAAAMCTTSLAPVYANGVDSSEKECEMNETAQITNEPTFVATNSLGEYLNQNTPQNEENFQNELFAVNMLNFSKENSVLNVITTQASDCTLKVRFISDDENSTLAAEYTTELKAGEKTESEIKVNKDSLPEFYTIEAVITGLFGKEMSEVFADTTNTKISKEVEKATVEDFDKEKVLNLDESNDTNFVVVSDETVLAKTTETSNILLSSKLSAEESVTLNADDISA